MNECLFGADALALPAADVFRRVLLSGALERATWHPLGFVHAQLERTDEFALRFHIWPPGERKAKSPDWQIHNHVFALTSRVLVGSIRNRTYELFDAEKSVDGKQLYEVKYGDGYSELLSMQRYVTVSCLSTQEYRQGDIYEVPCGVFHDSYVEHSNLVATLVKTDFATEVAPLVVGELDLQPGRRYEYRRTPVDQADLRRWFEAASDKVRESRADI